jgi:putative transposase
VLYTDNGSDFTSRHLEQVAADLKIQLIFSTPGKPRGRGRIERFFETVTQLFLAAQPGYAPPGGTVRGTPSLTLEELDRAFRTFVLDTYHRRPQRETRSAPQERWQEGGFLQQMPQSLCHGRR